MWPNIKNSRTHQYALKNTQIAPYILCPIQEVFFLNYTTQRCNKVRGRLRQRALRRTGKMVTTPRHDEDGEDDLDWWRIPLFASWLDLVVGAG